MPPVEVVRHAIAKYGNHGGAEFLGVSYKTFCAWMIHFGVEETKFDSKSMFSLADAARECGVSRATVSKWFREGRLPDAVKLNKTRVMIPEETINDLKARGA